MTPDSLFRHILSGGLVALAALLIALAALSNACGGSSTPPPCAPPFHPTGSPEACVR